MTGEFPAQRASNAEKVSIWWRQHVRNSYVKVHVGWQEFSNRASDWLADVLPFEKVIIAYFYRANSRLAPSQWETSLQSNAVSIIGWAQTYIESALLLPYLHDNRNIMVKFRHRRLGSLLLCRTLLPISFYVLSCIRSNKEFEFEFEFELLLTRINFNPCTNK